MLYYKIYLFRLIELFKKMMKKIILIAGPTASGKSSLANILAKKINGEIVNADSVQIYKDLKILTARPDIQKNDPLHHLYGFATVSYTHLTLPTKA